MAQADDFKWAIPIMRAGYAGRGLVYIVVAGFSLYAIWHGGQAKGTSSALAQLESESWGSVVLLLIFLGMIAYAVWRLIDSIYDLEDYGTDGKGIVARIGMVVTGILHLGVGFSAFLLLFTSGGGDGGGGSKIAELAAKVMEWPFGRIIVAVAGAITIGAGIYYLMKAYQEKYREKLYASEFTRKYNPVLKAGVAAQGIVVTIIGSFLLYAGWMANAQEAGGVGKSFDWLSGQIYGQILVTGLCLGLLGFAVFLLVNAGYRIVPKAAGDGTVSLATQA